MSKGFEYNSKAEYALGQAKRARRAVWTVYGSLGAVVLAGLVALVMLTPVAVWATILGIIAFAGALVLLIVYGDDMDIWWYNQRRAYRIAKEEGVRDE